MGLSSAGPAGQGVPTGMVNNRAHSGRQRHFPFSLSFHSNTASWKVFWFRELEDVSLSRL